LTTAHSQVLRGTDNHYTQLVRQGQWEEALEYACTKFDQDCADITIVPKDHEGVRATTNAHTNTITLYKNAFRYLLNPHPGWLAAIVHHEKVHTRQSWSARSIVNNLHTLFFRDHRIEAGLEYEAWKAMLDVRHHFALDCRMVVEIHQQMSYYGAILSNGGRLPSNEREEMSYYSGMARQERIIREQCQRETTSETSFL
jgi:hypothetical protein